MLIRPATPLDAPQICDIWNPIIRDTTITFTSLEKTPTGIQQVLSTPYPFLVATQGKQVLGFASYSPFRAGPGYASTMELSINLAKNARGQGIGSKLLGALEITAKTHTITALIAGVSGTNPTAIRFHETNGYTRVGTLPKVGQKFGQRLNLVLLQKLL